MKIWEWPPYWCPPSDSEEEDSLGQTSVSTQALLESLLELLLPRETVAGAPRHLRARGAGKAATRVLGGPVTPRAWTNSPGWSDQLWCISGNKRMDGHVAEGVGVLDPATSWPHAPTLPGHVCRGIGRGGAGHPNPYLGRRSRVARRCFSGRDVRLLVREHRGC